MAFFSFWDMVLSFAVAITTLPMPSDVGDTYDFAGPSYGNVTTCEAQAFAVLLGIGLTICSNSVLSLYYLSVIRYRIEDKRWRKWEPVFLVIGTCSSLVLPITFLKIGWLNPTPYDSFCLAAPYPYDCNNDTLICIRGSNDNTSLVTNLYKFYAVGFMGGLILLLIVSMCLIIHAVFLEDRRGRQKNRRNETNQENLTVGPLQSNIKALGMSALMYVTACVLTWSFTAVSFTRETNEIAMSKQIFQPLQGFFNAVIFIFHKIYNLQRADRDMSLSEALSKVLRSPSEVPNMLMSEIDLVYQHDCMQFFGADKNEGWASSSCEEGHFAMDAAEDRPPGLPADLSVIGVSSSTSLSNVVIGSGLSSASTSTIKAESPSPLRYKHY